MNDAGPRVKGFEPDIRHHRRASLILRDDYAEVRLCPDCTQQPYQLWETRNNNPWGIVAFYESLKLAREGLARLLERQIDGDGPPAPGAASGSRQAEESEHEG